MLDKKKHHFLQLVIIFGAVTILSLLSAWGHRPGQGAGMAMMGQSMGKMMRTMHTGNIKLSDLFLEQKKGEMASGMNSHHPAGENIRMSYYITTGIIVIFLPLILAGAAFLAVMWMR